MRLSPARVRIWAVVAAVGLILLIIAGLLWFLTYDPRQLPVVTDIIDS